MIAEAAMLSSGAPCEESVACRRAHEPGRHQGI